jgi:hypothetical protein
MALKCPLPQEKVHFQNYRCNSVYRFSLAKPTARYLGTLLSQYKIKVKVSLIKELKHQQILYRMRFALFIFI